MAKYKICVYAISKNESEFVNRWMDAVAEADLVVVVDTGSTDNTVQLLRARGAQVYEESIVPWRFDVARNMAMDYIPKDYDICVSNDIDEVFESGWRAKLEAAWKSHHTRARYWFTWSQREDGKPEKRFLMEKIHHRHGFRWVHPVHEVLEYEGSIPDSSVFIDTLVLHHHPDPKKTRSQYLSLLELSSKENPQDDRTMFWLGREYIFKGQNDEGIRTLKRHLQLPSATWDEERSASMRFISRAYLAKGDHNEARRWLFRAIAECQSIREPWLDLAQLGYYHGDWTLSYFAAEKGLSIKNCSNSYLVEPLAWGHGFYDFGAIASYQLGLYKQACEYAQSACEVSPQDERLQKNLKMILQKRKETGE